MQNLFLADLSSYTEQEIKEHICESYVINGEDLQHFEILIAYESVGSWGCDSSSFFLLRHKETGALYENHASHCSCYGFENQWTPEKTELTYLQSNHFFFATGGYDDDNGKHINQVKDFLKNLKQN